MFVGNFKVQKNFGMSRERTNEMFLIKNFFPH